MLVRFAWALALPLCSAAGPAACEASPAGDCSSTMAARWGGKAPKPGQALGILGFKRKSQLSFDREPAANTITVRGVLNESECKSIIQAAETSGLELQTSRGPAYGEATRHHSRCSFEDPDFAAALWNSTGLAEVVASLRVGNRRPIGLNDNIRVYRYVPGDVFGQHIDQSNVARAGRTEYTLLIYLTGSAEGLQGGETAFYVDGREAHRVAPVAGSALLHQHGRACLLHEALPVSAGTKWVLRSDVVFGE
mmetsp:Transcript_39959/g.92035  ORF Transcript_39959/g.92035 Transcript_39959/m.92035 type:complete len:251 (-) Transcript_39959:49-801(-)